MGVVVLLRISSPFQGVTRALDTCGRVGIGHCRLVYADVLFPSICGLFGYRHRGDMREFGEFRDRLFSFFDFQWRASELLEWRISPFCLRRRSRQ